MPTLRRASRHFRCWAACLPRTRHRCIPDFRDPSRIAHTIADMDPGPGVRDLLQLVPTITNGRVLPFLELRVESMASAHYLQPRSADSGY